MGNSLATAANSGQTALGGGILPSAVCWPFVETAREVAASNPCLGSRLGDNANGREAGSGVEYWRGYKQQSSWVSRVELLCKGNVLDKVNTLPLKRV